MDESPTRPLEPADHTRAALDQTWDGLGRAGGWWTADERIAIADECRAARTCRFCAERKDALSPYAVEGAHDSTDSILSDPTVDIIHRITSDPGRLADRWYRELTEAGTSAEELVEITGIIGVVTLADTLARALGQSERPLPFPAPDAGEPHRQKVGGKTTPRAWVPMVEPDQAEGMQKLMYEQVEAAAGFVFNVARSLTAVPEAVRDFFGAFLPNYSTHGPVRPGGLNRSQVELLASSTSAWNDCFY